MSQSDESMTDERLIAVREYVSHGCGAEGIAAASRKTGRNKQTIIRWMASTGCRVEIERFLDEHLDECHERAVKLAREGKHINVDTVPVLQQARPLGMEIIQAMTDMREMNEEELRVIADDEHREEAAAKRAAAKYWLDILTGSARERDAAMRFVQDYTVGKPQTSRAAEDEEEDPEKVVREVLDTLGPLVPQHEEQDSE